MIHLSIKKNLLKKTVEYTSAWGFYRSFESVLKNIFMWFLKRNTKGETARLQPWRQMKSEKSHEASWSLLKSFELFWKFEVLAVEVPWSLEVRWFPLDKYVVGYRMWTEYYRLRADFPDIDIDKIAKIT